MAGTLGDQSLQAERPRRLARRTFAPVLFGLIALSLSACATGHIEISRQGALPPSGASIAAVSADGAAPPADVTAAVAQALAGRGLVVGKPAPAFYVEEQYSERQANVGAYSQAQAPDTKAWLVQPAQLHCPWRCSGWVRDLTVRVTERASGREVFTARARATVRRVTSADWAMLVRAALSDGPPSEASRLPLRGPPASANQSR